MPRATGFKAGSDLDWLDMRVVNGNQLYGIAYYGDTGYYTCVCL